MTNPQNVTVIVSKLTQYLQQATDQYLRQELVSRINQLAEKYAPSNQWFIQTMNNVFELSGNTAGAVSSSMGSQVALGGRAGSTNGGNVSEKKLKNEMAHSILRLISEQAHELMTSYPGGRVPDGEEDIRVYAADTYVSLLTAKRSKGYANTLPDILLQVSAWVLGEYGHMSSTTSPEQVLLLLGQLMERQVDSPAVTKSWVLEAILKMGAKIAASGQAIPSSVVELVSKYQNSLFVDLQQRAFEFLQLVQTPRTLTAVVPRDNTFDLDIVIDEKLSFLDGYVDTALRNGAKPYNNDPIAKANLAEPVDGLYGAAHGGGGSKALKFQAYAAPEKEVASAPVHHHAPTPTHTSNSGLFEQYGAGVPSAAAPTAASNGDDGLRLNNVARRWGPQGYNDPDAAPAVAAAAAVPVAAVPAYVQQQHTQAQMPSPAQQRQAEEQARADRERERKAQVPVKPRELTEKEKFASSLFAGVGGAAAAPAPVRRTPVAAAAPVQRAQPVQQQAAPVPQQQSSTDFLGGLMDATPAPAPAPAKPAASAADPLDLLFGGGAPAPVQQQQNRPAAASSSGDLFDMLGGGGAPAPASSAAPALFDDPFGFGGSSSNGSAAASSSPASSSGSSDLFTSMGEGSTKFGFAGCSPAMSNALSAMQKGAENIVVTNPSLQVSVVRGTTPDATVLALFISNKSSAPIQGVQLSFSLPVGIALSYSGDGGAQIAQSGPAQQTIQMSQIASRSTMTHLLSLSLQSPSAFAAASSGAAGTAPAGSLRLQFQSSNSALTPFNLDLSPSEFLRPAPMKTDAYGAAWKALTDEIKTQARPSTCNTSADFMARMTGSSMNFHAVQTIGAENICSARIVLAPGVPTQGSANLLLVHGKVHSHVELIVKGRGREMAAAVAKQLAVVLK